MRISENRLILPALYVIGQRGGANTAQIKEALIAALHPTGEDAVILNNRNDTKFSQIVRNLMGSHYDTNGMGAYTEKTLRGGRNFFTLTPRGEAALEKNREWLDYLFTADLRYDDAQTLIQDGERAAERSKKLLVYREEDTVREGSVSARESTVRKRSQRLRAAALAHYTGADGKLRCAVCGFCFEEVYGERGRGFIELHHERPLYQSGPEGFETFLTEAVEHLKPVCSNCHRILHRGGLLTVDELRALLRN